MRQLKTVNVSNTLPVKRDQVETLL